jgi:alkylation response protein AidB-like acyl-CoA dehydrogenase
MRFALTQDQIAVRDTVREVLADTCPPSTVRASWTGGPVDRVTAALVGLGVPGMAVPEPDGGLGLSDVDLVPVLIEVGYAAVPLPVAETAAVAAPLFAAAGARGVVDMNDARSGVDSGARSTLDRASFIEYLPRVLAGDAWVAVRRSDGPVPWAGRASLVLDLTGPVARVRPVTGTDVSTVDGSRAARLLDDAPGELVTEDPALVALARDRADLATAAQLVGLGRRMLDLTVGYVKSRTQFGVPIGSFQAVKHHLADALLHLEFAEPTVYAAAWAVATGSRNRERDVSAAVVLAVDAARFVARRAIQCHGAIGYTVEYDLHLYAKRAWALAATCDLDAHLTRLAHTLDLVEEQS